MKFLRQLHLYLGCFFAPMLLFFSVSGLWQVFDWQRGTHWLRLLSTLHTGHDLKDSNVHLTSFGLKLFVAAMAAGLILSLVTGVVLAFRFGRGRLALASLVGGIVVPLALIFIFAR